MRRQRLEQAVREYMETSEMLVDGLGIVPRSEWYFPFDSVALEHLSKGFALCRACLVLLEASLPDEAYGLSRTLVECSTNLRFLTESKNEIGLRTRRFIQFSKTDKAFWYEQARRRFKGRELVEVERLGKEFGVLEVTAKATQHWSGEKGFIWNVTISPHPLDGHFSQDEHRKSAYAVDYYQTSSFVHCSQPALDNYFPTIGIPFRVQASSETFRDTRFNTAFTLLLYLRALIVYALYGMNVDHPENLRMAYELALQMFAPEGQP